MVRDGFCTVGGGGQTVGSASPCAFVFAIVKPFAPPPNGGAHRRHLTAQPTDLAETRDRWRPVQRRVGPLAIKAFFTALRYVPSGYHLMKTSARVNKPPINKCVIRAGLAKYERHGNLLK